MKFVITGGHHNSALVVAKELISQGHSVNWIGHRVAAAGDQNDSAEYLEVTKAGIPFHDLVAGKTSFSLANLLNIPLGFWRASRLLQQIRPQAVLSFGGYLGLAVSLPAFLKHIPLFLHEQTTIAGKANKFVARLARRIYLTWPSSRAYYPAAKSLVVGLPIRKQFFQAKAKKLFKRDKPTLLILCGKQGSHTINKLIFANLENLLSQYNLVHQTGTSSATGDYEKAIALKNSLPLAFSASYLPYGYLGEDDIAVFMKSVDLVVGRSGAHTTYELGILGKKSVLIPFLSTHGREQLQNARMLERAKLATILPQAELTYPRLNQELARALQTSTSEALPLPANAADRLIKDLLIHLS